MGVRSEAVGLYPEDPSPDLGAWVEVTLQETRVCGFFLHVFFTLKNNNTKKIYLPTLECKLHECRECCLFGSLPYPQYECPKIRFCQCVQARSG